MKLDEMRKIASKRTPTPWYPIVEKLFEFEGEGRDGKGCCRVAYVVTPDTPIIDEKQIEADGEFIQLAHATYDKLLAVAIAAKGAKKALDGVVGDSKIRSVWNQLADTLEELEQE